jgi:hypothetical protein
MLIVSFLLYWQTLTCFFVFDDLSIIRIAWVDGGSWTHSLKPMSNGFWRPGVLLLGCALTALFGLTPLAFHAASVVLHATASVLTFHVCLRLYDGRRDIALASAILFVGHAGAWACAAQFQNVCDLLLAVCILGALLAWDRYGKTGGLRYLLTVGVFQIGALTVKESGVVIPVVLSLWTLIPGKGSKRQFRALGFFYAIALVYAVVALVLQQGAGTSYQNTGLISLNAKNIFRQGTDYMMSAFLPYLNTMTAPFGALVLPHWMRWVLRILAASGVLYAVWSFARKPESRIWTVPVLACVACLSVPSLLTIPPQGRMVYAALPFSSMLLAYWAFAVRACGLAGLRACGLAGLRACGLAGLRACGLAGLRACSHCGRGLSRASFGVRMSKTIVS